VFQAGQSRLTSAPEVVRSEIVGSLIGEVVDEPAVAERAVSYVGDVELSGGINEAVGLVEGFEGRVLGLDGVDSGDCHCVSVIVGTNGRDER
jgi:hypothetical protein